jgi:hypothetical protein
MGGAVWAMIFLGPSSFGIAAFNDCSLEYQGWTTNLGVLEASIAANVLAANTTWRAACNGDEACQGSVSSIHDNLTRAADQVGEATNDLADARADFLQTLNAARANGVGAHNLPDALAAQMVSMALSTAATLVYNYFPGFLQNMGLGAGSITAAITLANETPEIELPPINAPTYLGISASDLVVAQGWGAQYVECIGSTLADIGAMAGLKIQGGPPPPPAGAAPKIAGGPGPLDPLPPAGGVTFFGPTTLLFSMPKAVVDFVHKFFNQRTIVAGKSWRAYRGLEFLSYVPAGAKVGPIVDNFGNPVVPPGTPVCAATSAKGGPANPPIDSLQFFNYSRDFGCMQLKAFHLSVLRVPGKLCLEAGTNPEALLSGESTNCSFSFETDGPPDGPVKSQSFTYELADTNNFSIKQPITLQYPTDNPPAGSCYSWGGTGWYYNTSLPGCSGGGGGGTH